MDPDKFQKAYGKLVAGAWESESFKAELLSDPKKVFKKNGIDVKEGIEIRIVENTVDTIHFILPPKPSDELNDEQLEAMSGGDCCNCGWQYTYD